MSQIRPGDPNLYAFEMVNFLIEVAVTCQELKLNPYQAKVSDFSRIKQREIFGIFQEALILKCRSLIEQDGDYAPLLEFFLLKTQEPFLRIPNHYYEQAQRLLNEVYLEALDISEQSQKEKVKQNLARFLMETEFSAMEKTLNAWGCYHGFSKQMESLLEIDGFVHDLVRYANKFSVLYPPQMYFIMANLLERYQVDTYQEALTVFYKEHDSLLEDQELQNLQYSVSGANRAKLTPEVWGALEKAERLKPRNENKTALLLFSGPHAQTSELAGGLDFKIGRVRVVAIDAANEDYLMTLGSDGGRGLVFVSELVPVEGQPDLLELEAGERNFQYRQLRLPSQDLFSMDLENVLFIQDARGSALYLSPQELLQHLKIVHELMGQHPGCVFMMSAGIAGPLGMDWFVTYDGKDFSLEMQPKHPVGEKYKMDGIEDLSAIFGKTEIDKRYQEQSYPVEDEGYTSLVIMLYYTKVMISFILRQKKNLSYQLATILTGILKKSSFSLDHEVSSFLLYLALDVGFEGQSTDGDEKLLNLYRRTHEFDPFLNKKVSKILENLDIDKLTQAWINFSKFLSNNPDSEARVANELAALFRIDTGRQAITNTSSHWF